MLIPTAAMNPVITALETNRRMDPSLRTPATTITTPVTTERVNSERAGSGRPARSTSATMMAIAPVACTAMNDALVKNEAPTMPNR